MSASLTELLAGVEAATGPDRELDRAIWWPVSCLPSGGYMEGDDGARYVDVCFGYGEARDWRHLGPYDDAAAYTASLDAALALCERVLPGWLREFCERNDTSTTRSWLAFVYPTDGSHAAFNCRHKSPPLALLAAMLKALIAQEAA